MPCLEKIVCRLGCMFSKGSFVLTLDSCLWSTEQTVRLPCQKADSDGYEILPTGFIITVTALPC